MQAYISHIEPSSSEYWEGVKSFIIFFSGCNFKCPYCYSKHYLERQEENLNFLKEIKNLIKQQRGSIEAVVFSGGEPTLNRPALLNLARFSKSLGLKIGLETNGSKPFVIKSLIKENLLDFIALDIKSPLETEKFQKLTKSKTFFKTSLDLIKDLKQTLKILKQYETEIEIEVKTTVIPTLITIEDLFKIAQEIKDLRCIWILQAFENSKELINPNFKEFNSPSSIDLIRLQNKIKKQFPNIIIRVKEKINL